MDNKKDANKFKIGIYFSATPQDGGGYQQKINILNILKDKTQDYNFLLVSSNSDINNFYQNYFKIFNPYRFQLAINFIRLFKKINGLYIFFERLTFFIYSRKIKKQCDLIFFLGPNEICYKLKIPYIFTVNDLMHKYYPQFPEVSRNGESERRDIMYSNGFENSSAIVCESNIGKEDVIKFYNINPEKIFVFPFLPPHYLIKEHSDEEIHQIIIKYRLPKKFIFYPANFWFHKNHVLIINALSILKSKGILLNVVFTGSIMDEGKQDNNYSQVIDLADKLNVLNQVFYLGRIPDEDISLLYKLSLALVMPTFFGPTNIPYIEAFYLDCPVITSKLRGIKEQVGDAAILIDPEDPGELVSAILQLDDENVRRNLIENGHKVLNSWTKKDYSDKIDNLFQYCMSHIEN